MLPEGPNSEDGRQGAPQTCLDPTEPTAQYITLIESKDARRGQQHHQDAHRFLLKFQNGA
jgi:hypothetical protein